MTTHNVAGGLFHGYLIHSTGDVTLLASGSRTSVVAVVTEWLLVNSDAVSPIARAVIAQVDSVFSPREIQRPSA